MSKFIQDIITESDGVSFCPLRLLLIIGAIAFIALTALSVLHGAIFSYQEYGTGYGTLLGAGGAGIFAKGKVE